MQENETPQPVRLPIQYRYDLLDWEFIEAMAMIAHIGAEKYGERNWQKGRLEGDKSALNHAIKHLSEYQQGIPNDYGPLPFHLAQVAFNCMMEFYWQVRKPGVYPNAISPDVSVDIERMMARVEKQGMEVIASGGAQFGTMTVLESCPKCGHASHGDICINAASDSDCNCTFNSNEEKVN